MTSVGSRAVFKFTGALSALEEKALEIFDARLRHRQLTVDPDVTIRVQRNSVLAGDEFRLAGPEGGKKLELVCGGPAAFLYAVGKILRSGKYENGLFSPGSWSGSFRPAKPIRCVYLASHFCNVFEMWPLEKMEEYIEDMALLGYNYFCLVRGTRAKIAGSSEAVADMNRHLHLYKHANLLGMKCRVGALNIGYDDSPAEWRAAPTGHSFFGTEICTSNPDGLDYLERIRREDFEIMRDLDVGICSFWPYDQGGCGCQKCFPYGANGMFKLADRLLPVVRSIWPDIKISWSCWEFGREGTNEWELLYDRINSGKADFIDYLEIDSHGSFPEYPLTHPLPGHAQITTFPEISMWGRCPWGGFGATPLPKRFAALYGEVLHISVGGRLYSEGIFEDFNKAVYAAMFNSGTNETAEAIAEYARWEFGLPEALQGDFERLVELMEENHEGLIWLEKQEGSHEEFNELKTKPVWSLKGKKWNRTNEMSALAEKIDSQLPEGARKCWRWRQFMLRVIIDCELANNNDEPNQVTENAMNELVEIYGIDPALASRRVSPFTDEWLKTHTREAFKLNMKSLGVD